METTIKGPSSFTSMNYNVLLIKTEDQVNLLYREYANANLHFHNRAHVQELLDATRKIAAYYKLNDRWFFIVCAAACFRDTGYLIARNESHEQKSAELAQSFLSGLEVSPEDITEIRQCILATKMPQHPESVAEKILCDADNFFLGTSDFKAKIKLLRLENEALSNTKIDRVIALFNRLKKDIYETYTGCSLLPEKFVKSTTRYFDEFYETINKPSSWEKEFWYPCDPYGTGNVIIKGLKE